VLAALFLVTFSIKAAIFPAYFWLPASYHTPPSVVTAIFAGIITKVGMYVLYRVFSLIFYIDLVNLNFLLLFLACLTMIFGIIGAIAQASLRRILSFHIICQTGYILIGLGLANEAGLAAGLFFMLHTMLIKTALLVIGGIAEDIFGTAELKKMGGLAKREPLLATLWFLAMLSLAGFPPFSGFIGKLVLLKAALSAEQYLVAGVMMGVSLGTLFSLLKIWNEVFWKTLPKDEPEPVPIKPYILLPAAILVGISLLMGLGASFIIDYSTLAANQALDSTGYINVFPSLTLP
jgi:multicomponent Na+:H+ antiporter subunit D